MKPVKPKYFAAIIFSMLAFIPGCNSSPDKSILKEPIEIKGIKIGMTEEEVSIVTDDSDKISIGNVEGYVLFDYDSDGKLDHMDFAFGSRGGNAVLDTVKSKYPTAIINNDTLRIEDMNGTTLSVGSGSLTLKSKSYDEKKAAKEEEERKKRMKDI